MHIWLGEDEEPYSAPPRIHDVVLDEFHFDWEKHIAGLGVGGTL